MIRSSLLVLILLTLIGCTSVQPQEPTHAPQVNSVLSAAVVHTSSQSVVADYVVSKLLVPPTLVVQESEVTQQEPEVDIPQPPAPPVVAQKKPGATLIFGDSMVAGLNAPWLNKNLGERLRLDGKAKVLAKGGRPTNWLLSELSFKAKFNSGKYFEGFSNAIIVIGANDLGSRDSLDDIWKRLTQIYQILNDQGIDVYAATISPSKGNPSGMWGLDFQATEANRLELNRRIMKSELVHHVINLAASVDEGGLADSNQPDTMAKSVLMWQNDPLHPDPKLLIEIFKRELMIGTNKAEVITVTDKPEPGPYPDE